LTDQETAGEVEAVATLQSLIRTRMADDQVSYGDLARRSGDRLSRQRWQHYGSGEPLTSFPTPETLLTIAETLGVDVTTVVLAAAATVGLPVRRSGSTFAALLPDGMDRLPERTQEGLLTLVRGLVADAVTAAGNGQDAGGDETSLSAMDQPPDVRIVQRRRAQ
jgi:hypothetical protein